MVNAKAKCVLVQPVLVFGLCLAAAVTVTKADSSVCSLEPATGPCRGLFRRWYHNSATGQCEQFTYGGCQGNGNNFMTQEECQASCSTTPVARIIMSTDVCSLQPEAGPCRGLFRRWYHNPATDQCEQFNYGGCQGNGNNFGSMEECQASCSTTPVARIMTSTDVCSLQPEVGPCRGLFRRWYHNPATDQCEQFNYGGCQGNGNNFGSMEECQASCPVNLIAQRMETNECSLTPDCGPCRGFSWRWFYDPATGQCNYFVYGGCQGNGNNFQTWEDCMTRCSV